ncbi:hypothetical protein N7G274_004586 [Stereocaulon virgatum]|uniref:Uncharacterized protein n=1 Tax=Stereocaulon virgatum TaxID=373712 RepID=A0ABR4AD91_9LECA
MLRGILYLASCYRSFISLSTAVYCSELCSLSALELLEDSNSIVPPFSFVCSIAAVATQSLPAASPSVDDPKHILDPLSSTSYGRIYSPQRMILKLDCPGCPKYDPLCDTDATALTWGFTVNGSSPQILLNNDDFYPPSKEQGCIPITAYAALPVPSTTTIYSYTVKSTEYAFRFISSRITFAVIHDHGNV